MRLEGRGTVDKGGGGGDRENKLKNERRLEQECLLKNERGKKDLKDFGRNGGDGEGGKDRRKKRGKEREKVQRKKGLKRIIQIRDGENESRMRKVRRDTFGNQ